MNFSKVTDGLSKTLLAGERMAHAGGLAYRHEHPMYKGGTWVWGSATSWGIKRDYKACPLAHWVGEGAGTCRDYGSWHPHICHFAMCDASVRAISTSIDLYEGERTRRHASRAALSIRVRTTSRWIHID